MKLHPGGVIENQGCRATMETLRCFPQFLKFHIFLKWFFSIWVSFLFVAILSFSHVLQWIRLSVWNLDLTCHHFILISFTRRMRASLCIRHGRVPRTWDVSNAVSNAFGYRLRTHRNCIWLQDRGGTGGPGWGWSNLAKMHPNAATLTLLTLHTRFNSTKEVCRFETYQNPLGVTLAMFHWTLSATRLDTRSLYHPVSLYLCCKSGIFNRNNSTT